MSLKLHGSITVPTKAPLCAGVNPLRARKAGNATILRGGSEAIHSNRAIATHIAAGLADAGLPESAVQVVATVDRAAVGALITMSEHVDVIVPRGGKSLIERVSREAPVLILRPADTVAGWSAPGAG